MEAKTVHEHGKEEKVPGLETAGVRALSPGKRPLSIIYLQDTTNANDTSEMKWNEIENPLLR